MDNAVMVLRAIHILCGVYWAGTLFFLVTLLQPSVADAGPEGGKVQQALIRRRFLEVVPLMAILTILSGIELYRRISGGFDAAWIGSGAGMTLTVGAVAALIAFAIGMSVLRPSAKKVGPLVQRAQGMPEGPERDAVLANVQRLRRRMVLGGRWVAGLLVITVITMAIFRHV
ncbi:MAG: hypothetical protein PVI01_17340 [Gemmatimonadales bacterium]|jgi:uncharacterized membrane protein